MNSYSMIPKSRPELRRMAREQLKGNWGKAILVCLIAGIINGAAGALSSPASAARTLLGIIITFILLGPLSYGMAKFFLALSRGEQSEIEVLFDGFRIFKSTVLLGILMVIFVYLWALLLIVPGIIAAFRYSQAYYIMLDNPGMGAMDAINASKKMMKGHKGRLFVLSLTFIGWGLLACLTLGIGFLWLIPYIQATMANFYNDLKGKSGAEAPAIAPENQ